MPVSFVGGKWPKAVRLTSTSQFQKVRRQGKTASSSLLQIACWHSKGDSQVRIGLVTSRKVGAAVERNRVRRRLREIFRKLLSQITPGAWLVVTAKPRATSASFAILQEECLLLSRRLSILPPVQ